MRRGNMSQHFGFGGCQGTEGEIAHLVSLPNHTLCVNSLTRSQCITSLSVCLFVLKILAFTGTHYVCQPHPSSPTIGVMLLWCVLPHKSRFILCIRIIGRRRRN